MLGKILIPFKDTNIILYTQNRKNSSLFTTQPSTIITLLYISN